MEGEGEGQVAPLEGLTGHVGKGWEGAIGGWEEALVEGSGVLLRKAKWGATVGANWRGIIGRAIMMILLLLLIIMLLLFLSFYYYYYTLLLLLLLFCFLHITLILNFFFIINSITITITIINIITIITSPSSLSNYCYIINTFFLLSLPLSIHSIAPCFFHNLITPIIFFLVNF